MSLSGSIMARLGQIQRGETATAIMMLLYSFLAMASYNIVKPVTRSRFIDELGAANIAWVQLAAGFVIGGIMLGYSWLIGRLPRRWGLPITQAGIVGLLVGFWILFRAGGVWVPVAFYLAGLILGILLISQFWTLANIIYDPRQGKRLFGFIGAGAPLGGIAGSLITLRYSERIGTVNLILISALIMAACSILVTFIIRRERLAGFGDAPQKEKGVGLKRAVEMLRESKHLQIIALVISFAAIGANIIEMQLNLAAEATKGQESAIAAFLAEIQAWVSLIGFVLQIGLTSRIHRFLGIGFALLILPISLGSTALVMLLNAALWAPGLARVLDQSLRYTVDKTTREILFMPLPVDLKTQAKPFVDVSVDRFAKGLAAIVLLILLFGLHFNWQQLSYASLTMMILWLFMAVRARKGYLEEFRRSIESREVNPAELRLTTADLSAIEALVEELGETDERRVLYAIEVLDSLGKRNLVTPLILYHESAAVRSRALSLLNGAPAGMAARWLPSAKRLMTDISPEVRVAAVGALAGITEIDTRELVRPCLRDENPSIAMTAAMVLARSDSAEDQVAAEALLQRLAADPRDSTVEVRKELAAILMHVPDENFRRLLLPLMADSNLEVAREALHSVRKIGPSDFIFVPQLVSLLRQPELKGEARELLIGYGEEVLDILRNFLEEEQEDIKVRCQIPATIARITCPKSADMLLAVLANTDGMLRHECIAGLERLRRMACLELSPDDVQRELLRECDAIIRVASLFQRCFGAGMPVQGRLLARVLRKKIEQHRTNLFRLISLSYPWKDVTAARISVERGGHARSRSLEYLDNLLPAAQRRRVLPALEQSLQVEATVTGIWQAAGPAFAEALRELIADPDPEISAAAARMVRERKLMEFSGAIEALLEPGAARDWRVVEAASWSLTALRLHGDQLQGSRHEALPAVEVAARLETLPLFASVSVDDLFRIASEGRQRRYSEREIIRDGGSLLGNLHFLIDGKARRQTPAGPAEEIDAPAPLDFEEYLLATRSDQSVRAATPCVCLAFAGNEFETLMAGSAGLIEGMLRMLCINTSREIGEPIVRGNGTFPRLSPDGLKHIDKVVLLESTLVFSSLPRKEMLSLAAIATEQRPAPGTLLFAETAPPALHAVVAGSIRLEEPEVEGFKTAAAGDMVGLYQMMAGIPLLHRGTSACESVILRVELEDFVDLLMQRPQLLRALLAKLFARGAPRRA